MIHEIDIITPKGITPELFKKLVEVCKSHGYTLASANSAPVEIRSFEERERYVFNAPQDAQIKKATKTTKAKPKSQPRARKVAKKGKEVMSIDEARRKGII